MGRDMGSEGRQCEESEGLPQPLHQVHAGSVQAAAVEGEDHIKRTGRDHRHDREHGRDPQKASPQVARTCSKDGIQQDAQATPV